MKADLHLHTSASDGTWTPEELTENLINAGIGVFAVTDHDSVENVNLTADLVKNTDLRFMKGVEVNTTENGYLFHILGYNIDPENLSLKEVLSVNRNTMNGRDERSIRILKEMGYPVSPDEYRAYVNDPARGGWKALSYAVDKGLCQNHKDFFRLFKENRSQVTIDGCVKPERAISAIKAAGGIPVLAHPGADLYGKSPATIVSMAIERGVEGVECFHPENDDETTQYCLALCRREKLYITGGSDCHGTFVKERRLGKPDIDLDQLSLWDF